jgi:hypothetical protein
VLEAFSGQIEGISPDEGILIKAAAHQQLGELQQQYETLDAGCRSFPGHFGIRLALVDLLEAQGYAAEATRVLGGGLDHPQPPAALYTRLAKLLAPAGRAGGCRQRPGRAAEPGPPGIRVFVPKLGSGPDTSPAPAGQD